MRAATATQTAWGVPQQVEKRGRGGEGGEEGEGVGEGEGEGGGEGLRRKG